MNELNLPAYDVKIRGTREQLEIFDFLRRRYVALTPEEWVRKGLLANEVALVCGDKTVRCDSIVYASDQRPLMIIEYKAPTVPLTQHVFTQISSYNLLLHVDHLIVSNGLQHYCLRMDYDHQSYQFLPTIPPYSEL